MSDGESLKLRFALDVEDGWPPVSVEGIWCAVDDGAYRVENAPFFIHGLAFGDRFQAEPDPVNGLIFEFTLLAASGHSLAWVLASEQKDFTDFRQALLQIGCGSKLSSSFHCMPSTFRRRSPRARSTRWLIAWNKMDIR